MANRLEGFLRLSQIPKELIKTNKQGIKGIYISVVELREQGKYGATHTLTTWDSNNKKTIYLSDLKPKEWEEKKDPFNSPKNDSEDLPF